MMKNPLFRLLQPNRKGFSLIEILTVLVIIAVLAGMILPAISLVRTAGKKSASRATVNQLSLALRSYYEEYGKWPNDTDTTKAPNAKLDPDEINGLVQILSGINANLKSSAGSPSGNPRGIRFMEFKAADIFLVSAGVTNIYDPWQRPYQICLDGDEDGTTVGIYGTALPLGHSFAVWSTGPDQAENGAETDLNHPTMKENKDNITSWN